MNELTKMIIDADTGIDDALAIMYALKHPDVVVEGITTMFGNTDADQATDNTLRLIKLVNPGYEVPVAKGAAAPLERPWQGPSDYVHGANGIGNASLPPTEQRMLDETAADFLIRKADELAGELVLVPMGRLTNVALALQKDPSFVGKIKHVYVMGGTFHAPGNVTPVSEANFWGDPEAAKYVLESGLPITIVGLDVTLQTLLTRDHLAKLERLCPPENRELVAFMKESLQFYFDFYQKANNLVDCCPMHDPLTVLVAVNPSLVTTRRMKATVNCAGDVCAGMLVADLRAKPSVGREVEVCLDVDANRALNQLLSVFL